MLSVLAPGEPEAVRMMEKFETVSLRQESRRGAAVSIVDAAQATVWSPISRELSRGLFGLATAYAAPGASQGGNLQ